MATTAASFSDTAYEFRSGKAASYITSGGASFLKASTNYEAASFPLHLLTPRPEIGSASRYKWAHSGFAYNVVVAVQGGAPPFRYELVSGPSGATITEVAPSWNPNLKLYGRVNWPSPSGTGSFLVRVTDQEGTAVIASWSAVTDTSKFVVLDAVSGNDTTGAGTLASPWQTMAKFDNASTSDATHAGKIVVYRAGTYTVTETAAASTLWTLNANKPLGHIRYPGESPVLDFNNASSSNAGVDDCYFAVGTINCKVGDNPHVFSHQTTVNRIVWDKPTFSGIVAGDIVVGDDNNSAIFFLASTTGHENITIIEPTWADLPTNANGFGGVDFYSVRYGAIIGGSGTNLNTYMGVWMKGGALSRISVWGVDFWDEATQASYPTGATGSNKFALMGAQGTGPTPLPGEPSSMELGYCRGIQADAAQPQQYVILLGALEEYGPLYIYRCTVAGRIGVNSPYNVTITGVDTGTNVVTYTASTQPVHGGRLRLTTTGALPSPLGTTTDYYLSHITFSAGTGTCKLCASYADAIAGTAIDLTTAGSGTNKIVQRLGTATMKRVLQYCDAATPVGASGGEVITETANVVRPRSAMATELVNGTLTGAAIATYYGLTGAEMA